VTAGSSASRSCADELRAPADVAAGVARARRARGLTAEQEQAVARREGPLLLSAAAGSGKTSVIVERFARAVCDDGLAPGKILAITFTERAAGELRERVRARLLELGQREAARDTEGAFVGTFHGFCARLLRAHALMAGLDPEFTILEEALAARLRRRAFAAGLRAFLRGEPADAVDLIAAYGADRAGAAVQHLFAQLRSRGEQRPRLPHPLPHPLPGGADLSPAGGGDGAEREEGVRACVLFDQLLGAFARSYEQMKGERQALDFDDLELRAGALLRERESVRAAWSERFELLMVDEFQDTNPRQLEILSTLERGNLMTVGDERQSIYGFRDADVGLFRARRQALEARGASLELTLNFRSSPAVLDVINAAFHARFGNGHSRLRPGREEAGGGRGPLGERRASDAGPPVELLLTSRRGWEREEDPRGGPAAALGVPPWRRAEARMLAGRVAELVAGGTPAGDVVVLMRALGDLDAYEGALQDQGLRTLAAAGGFWGRQQVVDLVAYLRAVANPLDELALFGVLASPLAGLSSDALVHVARAARRWGDRGVWAAVRGGDAELDARLAANDRRALAAFRERFEGERRTAGVHPISRLIERAIEGSGYREHVLGLEGGERRWANVHKLLALARRFEAGEGRDLRGFLDHVAELEDLATGPEPDAPIAGVEPDTVRLMSIHAAKGLEFPVVCIADLGRSQNTSVPDLLVDGERIGVRLVRLDGADPVASLDFPELCEELRRTQAEEEDRILYVAMTRARERLLLSGAVDFERWPEPRNGAPAISWLGATLAPGLSGITSAHLRSGGGAALDLPAGDSGRASIRCLLNAPPATPAAEAEQLPLPIGAAVPGAGAREAAPTRRDAPTRREVPAASPADPFDGLGSLSYTALSELERCGYRYYVERVLGVREARPGRGGSFAQELDAGTRGALVHGLLESVDFTARKAPSAEEVGAGAERLGVRLGRRGRGEIAELVGAMVRAGGGPGADAGRSPAARVAAAERVRREHPFAFAVDGVEPLIVGVVDVIAREPDGGVLVLDYKTDAVRADADLGALVRRAYGAQRLLYALAVLREGAPSVEIVHWFLERPEEWVAARYEAEQRAALEAELAGRLERARRRAFSVSEHPHRELCGSCPARAGLCSWGDAETLRAAPAR
jgi:ATP-dependent helicase/nuclease subunit A